MDTCLTESWKAGRWTRKKTDTVRLRSSRCSVSTVIAESRWGLTTPVKINQILESINNKLYSRFIQKRAFVASRKVCFPLGWAFWRRTRFLEIMISRILWSPLTVKTSLIRDGDICELKSKFLIVTLLSSKWFIQNLLIATLMSSKWLMAKLLISSYLIPKLMVSKDMIPKLMVIKCWWQGQCQAGGW